MQQPYPDAFMYPARQSELEDLLIPLTKRVLLFSDGSTTRLLQNLVGNVITVEVHHQAMIPQKDLPPVVTVHLPPEGPFLYRVSSLSTGQTLLSTNVVYASKRTLPETLQAHLSAGTAPLGSLIGLFETRRALLRAAERCSCDIQPLFQDFILSPSHYPVKEYHIIHQEKCWFYVCEVFHLEHIVQEAYRSLHRSQHLPEGVAKK